MTRLTGTAQDLAETGKEKGGGGGGGERDGGRRGERGERVSVTWPRRDARDLDACVANAAPRHAECI